MGSRRKRKRTEATNSMGRQRLQLAEDLIASDILPRLPVKSLLRFKSVCKGWKSLISDDRDFANLQLQFQHRRSYGDQYYLVHENLRVGQVSSSWSSSVVSLKLKIEPSRREVVVAETRKFSGTVSVLGSSNGLICLSHETGEQSSFVRIIKRYELWNPATGGRWLVPAPPSLIDTSSHSYFIVCEGFGYIPSRDDYKIVLLQRQLSTSNSAKDPIIHHALTFSCRTNTWTSKIKRYHYIDELPIHNRRMAGCQPGVQVGESLHWGLSFDNCHPIHPIVLAYNLANDSIHWLRVSLPNPASRLPTFYVVSKIRERLCVSWPNNNNHERYTVDVCMLDDDGSNWKRIFTLEDVAQNSYHGLLEVKEKDTHKNNDSTTVLILNHQYTLVSTATTATGRQDQTLLLRLHPLASLKSFISAVDYIQTLVTPFSSHRGPTTMLRM